MKGWHYSLGKDTENKCVRPPQGPSLGRLQGPSPLPVPKLVILGSMEAEVSPLSECPSWCPSNSQGDAAGTPGFPVGTGLRFNSILYRCTVRMRTGLISAVTACDSPQSLHSQQELCLTH